MRRIALVLLLGFTAGCATTTAPETWITDKPGATAADLSRVRSECACQSVDAAHLDRGGLLRLDRDAYRACMAQHGYRPVSG